MYSILTCIILCADIRCFPRLGDEARQHTGSKRFEIRRHERVQRGPDVRHGSGDLFRAVGRTELLFCNHIHFYTILFYRYRVLGVCS